MVTQSHTTANFTIQTAPRGSLFSPPEIFLKAFCILLFAYAVLGRGFAGTRAGPIYIGDIVLLFGMAAAFLGAAWSRILSLRPAWLLLPFIAWGAARTVPYIPVYGRDALRDGAMWAYALFALIVAGICVSRPRRIEALVALYRRYAIIFAVAGTGAYLIQALFPTSLPHFPGTEFTFVSVRNGEVMVQAAGIFSFVLVGMRSGWMPLVLMSPMICLAMIGARAGMLAFFASTLLALMLKPGRRRVLLPISSFILGAAVLLVIASSSAIQLPFSTRSISAGQLGANILSIFGYDPDAELLITNAWRTIWWQHLIHDALSPDYFIAGKGFGINLTEEVYGDQELLRSPHNFHLNILARAGAVGFAFWILLQTSWAFAILRAWRQAKLLGHLSWHGFFAWLLAWWAAFMVNASFDVFLEGPMGATWFWGMFGLGLAGLWVFQYRRSEIFS